MDERRRSPLGRSGGRSGRERGGGWGRRRSPAPTRRTGSYFRPERQNSVTNSIESEAGQGAIRKNWSGCSIALHGVHQHHLGGGPLDRLGRAEVAADQPVGL